MNLERLTDRAREPSEGCGEESDAARFPTLLRAETLQGNREGSAPEETGHGNHSQLLKSCRVRP